MTATSPSPPNSLLADRANGWGLVWPHRLAVALVCVVFPLIWVGGLVTSYNAGMAVPDWPNTYGYNLFLYPWTTWLFGPWDLFIEHGHRLLGALAGFVTIALVISVFRASSSKPLRWAALVALALVVGQGVLGGLRVLLNERQLAMIHGCTGPLFFAWCVGVAAATSRWWSVGARDYLPATDDRDALKRLATATLLLAYLQLVLGAQLRHAQVMFDPRDFRVLVFAHLAGAAALAGHVLWLAWRTLRSWRRKGRIAAPAVALFLLTVAQIGLGAGAWIVNYGWPDWSPAWSRLGGAGIGYTIESEGWMQANIVTTHVAVGSLILGVAAQLAVRSWRIGSTQLAPVGAAVFASGAMALADGAGAPGVAT